MCKMTSDWRSSRPGLAAGRPANIAITHHLGVFLWKLSVVRPHGRGPWAHRNSAQRMLWDLSFAPSESTYQNTGPDGAISKSDGWILRKSTLKTWNALNIRQPVLLKNNQLRGTILLFRRRVSEKPSLLAIWRMSGGQAVQAWPPAGPPTLQ